MAMEGPASDATLSGPLDVIRDASGNLYIAEDGGVRLIDTAGNISTFYVPPTTLGTPTALALDASGALYVADGFETRKLESGQVSSVFGGSGALGVAVSASGSIYFAITGTHKVLKQDASGVVTTFAGTGAPGSTGDGGPATEATLNGPTRVAVDASENVYIIENGTQSVRKVSGGIITTVSGRGQSSIRSTDLPAPATEINLFPTDIDVDAQGNLYIANGSWVLKVDPAGMLTIAAGQKVDVGSISPMGDDGPSRTGA
jgi:streptogramin lyase